MKAPQFIEVVLIKEISEVLQKHHYLSFLLMSSGIEFLGACLDNDDFYKKDISKKRFVNAIETLFPDQYKPYGLHLFENLRCGLAHVVCPKEKIGLTQLKENKRTTHLSIEGNGCLILIAEVFYEDFKTACRKVITDIQNGTLAHPKLHKELLTVPSELQQIISTITAMSSAASQ